MLTEISNVADVKLGQLISFIGEVEGEMRNKLYLITEINKTEINNETYVGDFYELSGIDETGQMCEGLEDVFAYAEDNGFTVRVLNNDEVSSNLSYNAAKLFQSVQRSLTL